MRAMYRLPKPTLRHVAIALLVSTLAASCSLECLFVHDIVLAAPGRPRSWEGADAIVYEVAWRDEEGLTRSAVLAEGGEIAIRLSRGTPQAILAIPLWAGARLLPAGALYPHDLEARPGDLPSPDPCRIALSFTSGYAAVTARLIAEKGVDPWAFPIEKLASVPVKDGKDPWSLAPCEVADAIISGTFRVSAFPSARTAFALPEGEAWIPESPLCAMSADGGITIAKLADGLHLFYGKDLTLAVKVVDGEVRQPVARFNR